MSGDDDTTRPANGDTHRVPEGVTREATWRAPDGSMFPHVVDASWMALRDDDDRAVAEVFSVSYLATGDGAGAERPVTFVFNGGPGAASAYLHVGAMGPRRVAFGDRGELPPPPSRLVDNDESWLAFTDLVFIDPVGTGWSRVVTGGSDQAGGEGSGEAGGAQGESQGGHDPKAFYGVERDLDSLVEFMGRWLSKHDRWIAPVFVAGESYGGYRAARMARRCNERGIGLSGTIIISPALEFALLDASDYDVLPWLDLVPTMALAAHLHGRSRRFGPDASIEEVRAGAEAFASGPLAVSLVRGAAASEQDRRDAVTALADLIGLPESLVANHELRIPLTRFSRALLVDDGLLLGKYDASVVGRDPFPDRDGPAGPDPTLDGTERVFGSGINALLRSELGLQTDRQYRLLSMEVNRQWKIDFERHALQSQVGATDDLRYGMALNPHMRVFITHGFYDMVTPYYASERLANLLRLDEDAARAVSVRHFEGGHMFYAWEESRRSFRDEVAALYADAVRPDPAA